MDNKELHNFLVAIGAMAEMSVQFYNNAINAGATIKEALDLTKIFIQVTLEQKHESTEKNTD